MTVVNHVSACTRGMLCQPQRQQSLDEDGAGPGSGGPCQLPSGCPGAGGRAQTHQRERRDRDSGVRHF